MSIDKRMDKALKNAYRLTPGTNGANDKFVLMSDCHRGDGSWSDDFAANQSIYFSALRHYYDTGFSYIELGDGDELWKFKSFSDISGEHSHVFWLLRKFFNEGRLYLIYGNHDMVKKNERWVRSNLYCTFDDRKGCTVPLFPGIKVHEAIILKGEEKGSDIVLVHGHQADFINDRLWRITRFFVRYLWRPLETLGVKDPTGAAKNYKKQGAVERELTDWSRRHQITVIAGHTHRPVFPRDNSRYLNDGSCVHPRCITAIELEGSKLTLVKWHICPREDGALAVCRDELERLEGGG